MNNNLNIVLPNMNISVHGILPRFKAMQSNAIAMELRPKNMKLGILLNQDGTAKDHNEGLQKVASFVDEPR